MVVGEPPGGVYVVASCTSTRCVPAVPLGRSVRVWTPADSPVESDATVAFRVSERLWPRLDRTATFLFAVALIASWPGPGSFTASRIAPSFLTLIETIEKALLTGACAALAGCAGAVELTVVSDRPPDPVGVPTRTVVPPCSARSTPPLTSGEV